MILRTTRFALATVCSISVGWFASGAAYGQSSIPRRTCSTMDVLARLEAENPELTQKMRAIEDQTAAYTTAAANGRVGAANITIPVVVHVIYANTTQNISDAQVQSQIDVLNEDFQKLNTDVSLVPAAFAGLASDPSISFCLAKTSPTGAPSTGIIRKSSTVASWGTDDKVKFTANGGDNAWDATRYLNLWVCNLGQSLLGYAQFPGGSVSTDGVVVLYSAFGRVGTVGAPYNKGRTATHEVGHWLNLRHIWGDANCGNDLVTDTPTQQTANYGCPTYPRITCSNSGDMSMNYMDYTDDACMYMFSTGQSTRMNALFASGGSRGGFASSTACNTVAPPSTCAIPAGLSSSSVSSTSATISWGSVSGAASYNVQYKAAADGAFTTVSSTSASLNLTGLLPSTSYTFQVQSVCGGTLGSSAYSALASFSTTAVPLVTYCTASGGSTADEWLAFVGLGTISNNSTGQSSPGYQNFTNLSASLRRGASATLSYRAGFRSGYTSREYWTAWIDFNGDGDFADAGEQIVGRNTSASASTNLQSSTFTVPSTAVVGATRLRIFMKYASSGTSCQTASYGQVEDYTINITAVRQSGLAGASLQASVAPNPAAGEARLTLSLPLEETTQATIRLRDITGKVIYTQTAEVNGALNDHILPLQSLAPGLYLVQVEVAGLTKVIKLQVGN